MTTISKFQKRQGDPKDQAAKLFSRCAFALFTFPAETVAKFIASTRPNALIESLLDFMKGSKNQPSPKIAPLLTNTLWSNLLI